MFNLNRHTAKRLFFSTQLGRFSKQTLQYINYSSLRHPLFNLRSGWRTEGEEELVFSLVRRT